MRLPLYEHSIFRYRLLFVAGLLLCVYFSYHIILGERSYPRLLGLQQAIIKEHARESALAVEKQDLSVKVKMLQPGAIEPDFLEERAREVLGFRRTDEIDIVVLDKKR